MYISPSDRPERMYRRGRAVKPEFSPRELLYFRYGVDEFLAGELLPAAIRLPQSVNRGEFSQPEDVLFHPEGKYNGLGVIEFRVEEIPPTSEPGAGIPCKFFMKHLPEEDNYSHSEIWADQVPETGRFWKPGRTAKAAFRIKLCRRIRAERIRIVAVKNKEQA